MALYGWRIREGNEKFHQGMLCTPGRILGHVSADFAAVILYWIIDVVF
jgi:hypothetical protein